MGTNIDVKIIVVVLLVVILIMLVGLAVTVLKDHKSSFKFYKSILDDKNKKDTDQNSQPKR